MSVLVLDALKSRFGAGVVETHSAFGDDTAVVDPSVWKAAARFLRDDPTMAFELFVDLTAVDYPDRDPRFEVVMHLYSVAKGHRVRLKTRVGAKDLERDETCEVDTVRDVWIGADWFEREVYDLFGIRFAGHPDMRRILMYPEFTGHPLRKDYPAQLAQPLVEYRTEEEAGVPLDKQAPFRADEGMSFGRRSFEKPVEN